MTREEIMRLEGRELDAVIHSKVMGKENVQLEIGKAWTLPKYSCSIEWAWEVVDRLRKVGHWVDIRDDKPSGWRVSFGEDMTARADTAPLAICRAALLATNGRA